MGTSFRWVLVRAQDHSGGLPDALREGMLGAYGTFGGWFVGELRPPAAGGSRSGTPGWRVAELDALVRTTASGGPGLGICVSDSDFAYMIASAVGATFTVVTDSAAAAADADGRVALKRAHDRFGSDPIEGGARALSDWSEHAPISADADEIVSILTREELYAESRVAALLRLLGLPTPPQAHARYHEALFINDRGGNADFWGRIDNTRAAFVVGQGIDFWGVWRREGGPPIVRFVGRYADVRAGMARAGMLFPPPRRFRDAIVIQERLPVRTRVIMGVTENGYALWRSGGGEPIERYPFGEGAFDTLRRRFVDLAGPASRG